MLGPHVIGQPGALQKFCSETQPNIIKYVDPDPTKKLITAGITVGRIHAISEDDGDLRRDPVGLGRRAPIRSC